MAGVPGLKCPECGRGAKSERELGRPRRKWGLAVASAMVLLVAIGLGLTPRVRHRGWIGATPTWMLAVAMNVYDTADHRLAFELMFRARAQGRFDGIIEGAMIERHAKTLILRGNHGENLPAHLLKCVPVVRAERVVGAMLDDASSEDTRRRGVRIAELAAVTPLIEERLWRIVQDDPSVVVRTRAVEALSFESVSGSFTKVVVALENMCSPASMDAAVADGASARAWAEYVEVAVRRIHAGFFVKPELLGGMWRTARTHQAARRLGLAVLAKSDPTRINELCELSHQGPADGVAMMLQVIGTSTSLTPAMRACLLAHLQNPDASCREWAAWAIAQHGGGEPETIEALSAMVRAESTPGGMSAALAALVKLGAPDALVDELACGAAAGSTEVRERIRARFVGLGRRVPECLKK